MIPILTVFGLEIPAYSLCTVLAAAAAAVLAMPALRRAGLSRGRAAGLLGMMCAAFLVGARLWNAAVNPGAFAGSLKWYSLRLAGLSLYGGLTGAGSVLTIALRGWKIPLLPVLDAMTVPGGAAFCIARIGCFLNGCCAGRATRGFPGIVFPAGEAARQTLQSVLPFLPTVRTVHPTQLYELAGAAVGLLLLFLLKKRFSLRPGSAFLFYSGWFSAVRLAVLPLRVLPYPPLVKTVIYPLIYLGIILFDICAALWLRRPGKN